VCVRTGTLAAHAALLFPCVLRPHVDSLAALARSLAQMCPRMNKNEPPVSYLSRYMKGLLAAGFFMLIAPALVCGQQASKVPNIFRTEAGPADAIRRLSFFTLSITGLIFVFVFSLLVYVTSRYRDRTPHDDTEPAQVSGSHQLELAWTVIPVLIVLILFFATFRVIETIQGAETPRGAIQVTAIGHQYWWEFRYPELGVVTANELHIPVSDQAHPTPSFIRLLSADTDHSFWVPQLAGKTDLIPNRINSMWIDPHATGMYVGQCSMFCGIQHANMLLRVYVESPDEFKRWIAEQQQPANTSDAVTAGRQVFLRTACVNCHAIVGTIANGRFGPDLTHVMSRATIAAGAAMNTPENLKIWVKDPQKIKPGCLMPDMQLSDKQVDDVVAYLETLQ
jgi:cytochrome c oxidase subunit II